MIFLHFVQFLRSTSLTLTILGGGLMFCRGRSYFMVQWSMQPPRTTARWLGHRVIHVQYSNCIYMLLDKIWVGCCSGVCLWWLPAACMYMYICRCIVMYPPNKRSIQLYMYMYCVYSDVLLIVHSFLEFHIWKVMPATLLSFMGSWYICYGSQGNIFNCTSGTNLIPLRAMVQVTCTLIHVLCRLLEACRHTLQV